ncbi:MAG TPA: 1-(5-phosphoribosyl)-5-[(5-phosphoribosylamino)methylideneamino] imidazole-4-carboxamide isomerase [Nitrososphaeria archaeon]|jgi:phosphoribosylformimino-5-aminoimidazole carboxamide ribotide isomerase|nr:1-(5-phosphoribosyl)-5-[(5-phosphoribosylamino)methylideneamino] imidazole-4-carboxamide isomerase [Conexivisphaerales archaeon]HEU16970.1 1-(5-phosphoribosyl)-5-[(5-phosphoribosylamino)methylideneamino] imidazole-4-carboxamide isomerase [Nitrososphaeria archaeon]
MDVMPSIDLEAGRAVKRIRGVRGTGLVLGDPVDLARRLADAGAKWIHVVDLDGAEMGRPLNMGVLRSLKDLGLMVQYGGGLRTAGDVEAAISAGADRVVIGSAWTLDPSFMDEAASGGRAVIAAIDERGGRIVHGGWRAESELTLEDALRILEDMPVAGYLYTQVDVEGTMGGPDVRRVRTLRGLTRRLLVCAGGIASMKDLEELCSAGADGAVLGMALYSGAIALEDALELARRCS